MVREEASGSNVCRTVRGQQQGPLLRLLHVDRRPYKWRDVVLVDHIYGPVTVHDGTGAFDDKITGLLMGDSYGHTINSLIGSLGSQSEQMPNAHRDPQRRRRLIILRTVSGLFGTVGALLRGKSALPDEMERQERRAHGSRP